MLNILMIPIIELLLIGMTIADGPDQNQSDFIVALNEERREIAKSNNISNMHELSWNEELQKTAETLIVGNPWPDSPKMWRFTVLRNYKNGIEELKNSLNSYNKNEIRAGRLGGNEYVPGMEHIHPLQKNVACADLKDDHLKLICLFGPEGNLFRKLKKGTPGSGCSPDFPNNNGLCSLPPKTELTTPSETITVPNLVEITTASAIIAPAENPTVPSLQQSAETLVHVNPTIPPQPVEPPNDLSSMTSITTTQAPNPQSKMQTKNPRKAKTTTFYDKKLEEYDEKGGDVADEDDVDPTTLSSFSSSLPIFIVFLFVCFIFIVFEQ